MFAALVSATFCAILVCWTSDFPDLPMLPRVSVIPFEAAQPLAETLIRPGSSPRRLSSSGSQEPLWSAAYAAPLSFVVTSGTDVQTEDAERWSIFGRRHSQPAMPPHQPPSGLEHPGEDASPGGGLFQAPPGVIFPSRTAFTIFGRVRASADSLFETGGPFQPFESSQSTSSVSSGGLFHSPGRPHFLARRLSAVPSTDSNASNFSWVAFFGFSFEESSSTTGPAVTPPPPRLASWGLWVSQFWTIVGSRLIAFGFRLHLQFLALVKMFTDALGFLCGPNCIHIGYALSWLPYQTHLVWVVPLALGLLVAHTLFTWVFLAPPTVHASTTSLPYTTGSSSRPPSDPQYNGPTLSVVTNWFRSPVADPDASVLSDVTAQRSGRLSVRMSFCLVRLPRAIARRPKQRCASRVIFFRREFRSRLVLGYGNLSDVSHSEAPVDFSSLPGLHRGTRAPVDCSSLQGPPMPYCALRHSLRFRRHSSLTRWDRHPCHLQICTTMVRLCLSSQTGYAVRLLILKRVFCPMLQRSS